MEEELVIEPMFERLIVKPDPEKERLGSGILYAPDSAKRVSRLGTVVAVAPDVLGVVPGDRIQFSPFCGSEVQVGDDRECIVMHQRDIQFKFKGAA